MATEQGQEKQSRQDLERKIIERAWQDESFLALLRSDPRSAVTQVLGVPFPQDWNIEVHEEKFADKTLHLVIPPNPEELKRMKEELSDEELELVSGGGYWFALGMVFALALAKGEE